jgi:hypothetical protein
MVRQYEAASEVTEAELQSILEAIEAGDDLRPSPAVESLMRECRWVTGSLVGSQQSRLNSRNDLRAYITAFGRPGIWGTLNPSDADSNLILKLGNYTIDLDDIFRHPLPTRHQRKVFLARHPVAAARFFRKVMELALSILIGSDKQGRKKGLFGHCKAHYATIESQGRGSLHAHFLLWLDEQPLQEDILEALQQDEEFKALFTEYLDAIISHDAGSSFDEAAEAAAAGMVVEQHAASHPAPSPYLPPDLYLPSMNVDKRTVSQFSERT